MPDPSDMPPWATPEWLAWLRQIVTANLNRHLRQRPPDQPKDERLHP